MVCDTPFDSTSHCGYKFSRGETTTDQAGPGRALEGVLIGAYAPMTPSASIEPTALQLERLVRAAAEEPGPVVMINLLRFADRAGGIDAADAIGGEEAYARYAAAVVEHLDRVGARLLLALRAGESVIGPDASEWDMVLAVEYPSRRVFLEMTTDPGYLQIHGHRAAGLADSRLIACTPVSAWAAG